MNNWLTGSAILACMALTPTLPLGSAARADTLPPLTGRVIEYDTREVTWPALDVSPDGRTILFDLLGDIYALSPQGGKARPVMSGTPFDTQPVFSPDGRHIAFVSDRDGRENLWVADADGGNARRVSDDDAGAPHYSSPAWSPDGRTLYVSRMIWGVLAFELWSFDVASGKKELLVKAQPGGNEAHPQRRNAMGVAVSPDGKTLYYATKAGTTWSSGPLPHWSIARFDLATRTQQTFMTTPGGAMHPALSHDGRWLAYATTQDEKTVLRMRNLQDGTDRLLYGPLDPDGQMGGYYSDLLPRFTFSADDRSIYLGLGGGLKTLDVATGALSDIPFEAHVRHEMGPELRRQHHIDTGPVHVRVIQTPRLSPDGRRVVFGAVGRLYVADNRKGAKPRRLDVPGAAWQPSWSDDGRFVTYVTWTAKDGGQVWVAPVDGSAAPRQITTQAAYYSEPLFLAGGRDVVAFSASQYDRLYRSAESLGPMPSKLVRLSVAGGAPVVLGDVGAAMDLRRDPDAARVRYYADGWISSHAVGADGDGAKRLVRLIARPDSQYFDAPAPLKNAQLSADGRTALVRYASQLYLVPVPAGAGKEPPVVTVSDAAAQTRRITAIGADFMDWSADMRSVVWSVGSTVRQLPLAATTQGTPATIEKRASTALMDVVLPRDVPKGNLLLRGARVLTMKAGGEPGAETVDDADLLIVDNRIAAIGPRGSVKLPRGTQIRDVSGKFIVPGFIDAHAHWFETRRRILDIGHWDFSANLAYGVTTGLDVQSFDPDVFGYADMIDAGLMRGERAFSTGEGVFRTSPMTSREDAIATLRRYSDYYKTPNIKEYMVGDRAERRHLIEASAALGLMPTTEGASDYRLDITQMLDGYAGNEHSLPIAPVHDDLLQMLVRTRISTVPTMLVLYGAPGPLGAMVAGNQPDFDAKLSRFVPEFAFAERRDAAQWNRPGDGFTRFARQAGDIGAAGGLLGVGAHGVVQGLSYHWELEAMASGGASAMQVLRAATIGSAEVIGRALDLGSIEPGKLADLLVMDRDPAADIRNTRSLELVMQNGRLYDAATLDEQWPQASRRDAQWFEGMSKREVAVAIATAAAFDEEEGSAASYVH